MNLDRELLFRFFNKETTLEEEKKIRLWIDECDEHRCEFFRERQLFDAILLHGDPSYEKESLVNRCEKLMIDKINQKRQEVFQCFF